MSVDWYWELDDRAALCPLRQAAGGTRRWRRADEHGPHAVGARATSASTTTRWTRSAPISSRAGRSAGCCCAAPTRSGRPRIISCSGQPRFSAERRLPRLLGRRSRHHRRGARAACGAARARRATASCSNARRRRSCCTAPGACSTPTRPRRRCAASRARARWPGFDLLDAVPRRGVARARSSRAGARSSGCAVGEGLPVADFALHSPAGQSLVGAGHGGARDGRRRAGDAVDLLRRHRAPRRRGRAAPLRGAAVAPVRDQPRLHHADRTGERPLRDGQPRLHAPHRLRGGRGDRAAPRSRSASGTTRPTATRLVQAIARTRQRRPT